MRMNHWRGSAEETEINNRGDKIQEYEEGPDFAGNRNPAESTVADRSSNLC